jgi:hypothetical protein
MEPSGGNLDLGGRERLLNLYNLRLFPAEDTIFGPVCVTPKYPF